MEINIRSRQSGKTLSLIKSSEIRQIPIVCANHVEVNRIMRIAKEQGYNIPQPISAQEPSKIRGRTHECLVDNADWILEQFLGVHIARATFTSQKQENDDKETKTEELLNGIVKILERDVQTGEAWNPEYWRKHRLHRAKTILDFLIKYDSYDSRWYAQHNNV